MEKITAEAVLHLMKPVKLVVFGEVTVYREDDIVKISKAYPQGLNQTILILNLEIEEGDEPMKGTQRDFEFVLEDSTAEDYKHVTIRKEGEKDLTVVVKIVRT